MSNTCRIISDLNLTVPQNNMVPSCILYCTDTVFISLDISSITPTKSTFFIHYISIPCFSYMLQCISHHLQGDLTCSLLNNTCFYTDTLFATVVESQNISVAVSWPVALNSNTTKTRHGLFLRTLGPADPSIIWSTWNMYCNNLVQSMKTTADQSQTHACAL